MIISNFAFTRFTSIELARVAMKHCSWNRWSTAKIAASYSSHTLIRLIHIAKIDFAFSTISFSLRIARRTRIEIACTMVTFSVCENFFADVAIKSIIFEPRVINIGIFSSDCLFWAVRAGFGSALHFFKKCY